MYHRPSGEELDMLRLLAAFGVVLSSLVAAALHVPAQAGSDNPGVTHEALRSLLEKARADQDVPALAAGVIRAGEKPLVAVVGVRKRGTETLATEHDQWHIGSNTKPIAALLTAMLIDQGLLDWDTPLEQIFPEHAGTWGPDLKKITPAHLLTHTSGLPPLGPVAGFLIQPGKGPPIQDREKVVKGLDSVKLAAKPGEKYQYSNLGYVVLGAIIDRRGKAPWEEQLDKKLFGPLGIKHWGLGPADQKEKLEQPWPHRPDGKPVPADGVLDNPLVMNSAGRVRLSVADYNRFLAETLKLSRGETKLLKPATTEKLFTNPYPVSPHSLSGWLGFRKQAGAKGLVLASEGSNTMNHCIAVVVPDKELAYCVLTNQGGPGGPGAKACYQVLKELRGQEKR
jgi:CubicO group peptidase (beta-lactamase class C family)